MDKAPITKILTEPYLLEAAELKKMGFDVDLFGCYIVNEIDKVDAEIELEKNVEVESKSIAYLQGKKEALEDIRNAYNILKKC